MPFERKAKYLLEAVQITPKCGDLRHGFALSEGAAIGYSDTEKCPTLACTDQELLAKLYWYCHEFAAEMEGDAIVQLMIEIQQGKEELQVNDTVYSYSEIEPILNQTDLEWRKANGYIADDPIPDAPDGSGCCFDPALFDSNGH